MLGISVYLLFGMQKINKRVIKKMKDVEIKTDSMLNQDMAVAEK